MLQWCRLFKPCQNLSAGNCVTVVQTVKALSEPTYQALCCRGADCLSNVRTYLPGTVLQGSYCLSNVRTYLPGPVLLGCRLFKRVRTYPLGTVLQWCRLFRQCWMEPTCRALCYRGADCLSSEGTYLPAGHCATVVQAV